jgi:hypothetical protein
MVCFNTTVLYRACTVPLRDAWAYLLLPVSTSMDKEPAVLADMRAHDALQPADAAWLYRRHCPGVETAPHPLHVEEARADGGTHELFGTVTTAELLWQESAMWRAIAPTLNAIYLDHA